MGLAIYVKKNHGRFKARLVVKGHRQLPGMDYEENLRSQSKFTTIETLLARSYKNDCEIEGTDVNTAFLNGTLEETIYMEVAEGVVIPTHKRAHEYQTPIACRLFKAIYGLKQFLRAWYGRINNFFKLHDFIRSDYSHSLFINYGKQVILLLFVNDLVVAPPTRGLVAWIRGKLRDEFEMTDIGLLTSIRDFKLRETITKGPYSYNRRDILRKSHSSTD